MTNSSTGYQPELEGMPNHEVKEPRVVAFGRFLKGDIYTDALVTPDVNVTDEEAHWFNVGAIKKIFLGPVDVDEYRAADRFDGVLLSPAERTALVRSPTMLAQTAMDRTVNAGHDLTEERLAAAERSRGHIAQSKLDAMNEIADGIAGRLADVEELRKEARAPGFAHKSPTRMHELLSASWQEFLNMSDILQIKRNWDDDKKLRFRKVVRDHLTTGSQRDRVAHWHEFLDFQSTYLNRKHHIFGRQIAKTRALLGDEVSEESR